MILVMIAIFYLFSVLFQEKTFLYMSVTIAISSIQHTETITSFLIKKMILIILLLHLKQKMGAGVGIFFSKCVYEMGF